jgi:hypothetical protein
LEKAFTFSVELDPALAGRWVEEYHKLLSAEDDLIGTLTARGASQVLRLALLYTLLVRSQVIREKHLEAALAVFYYSVESVKLLFQGATGNDLADKLYKLLAAHGSMMTMQFYQHMQTKSVDLHATLEMMERNGLVRRQEQVSQSGKKGRPAAVWELASALKSN